jgi:hypothetical protein
VEIKVQVPQDYEAEVNYDQKLRVLTIKPRFQNPNQTRVVQNIEVVGNNGRSNKFQVLVGGQNGRIRSEYIKETLSAFDAMPPEAKDDKK